MLHRLAAMVFTVAIALAGVTLAPCGSGTMCPSFAAQQMDCCKGPPAGISAARCCNGSQQVRHAPPATSERSLQRTLAAPALQAVTVDAPRLAPPQIVSAARIDPTAAPPGGTLIDQHTSLLL